MSITIPSLVRRYGDDVARIAGTHLAVNVDDFIEQLATGCQHLEDARINGAGDLEIAAAYLTDARHSTGRDQQVLLKVAVEHLNQLGDMADKYRLMA